MANLAERMDTVEGRLDRIERLTELHGAFVVRFEEKVDRYIEEAKEDREQAAHQREEDRQEAARERREMNKRWGELANKMGTVVEDVVAPSVRRVARELFDCGDEVSFVCRLTRVRSDDRSRRREFDALYVGTGGVVLNETKSSPESTDVRAFVRFIERGEFALYFPEYRHLPLIPIFSSLNLPDGMVTKLTRNGIYALAMGDEAMQVLNLDAVRRRLAAGRPSH